MHAMQCSFVVSPYESVLCPQCDQGLAIQLLSVPCWPELRSQPGALANAQVLVRLVAGRVQ